MPHVTSDELHAFDRGFQACWQRIGGSRVAVDTTCLRKLVQSAPQAAYRFVELHCVLAQSQPGYLQSALTVAVAYQAELGDDTPVALVMKRVAELGADEHLLQIGVAPDMDAARAEPPERAVAKAWWRSSGKESGSCDNCGRPVRRGEGYLIGGRSILVGDNVIDLGEELICQACFNQLQSLSIKTQIPENPQVGESISQNTEIPPMYASPKASQVFERVLNGEITPTDVEAWVQASLPLYQAPTDEDAPGRMSDREPSHIVDQIAAWKVRVTDLNRTVAYYTQEVQRLVDGDLGRAALLARILHSIARLVPDPQAWAAWAFNHGYILWLIRRYHEAAEALAEAVLQYRELGYDPLLEVTALSYLSDALYKDKQLDEALSRIDEFLDRATHFGFRGHMAMALRDKGRLLAEMGRNQESLDYLRRALQLRRLLSDEEIKQQSVVSVTAFLDALGQAARRFGYFEEAIAALTEVAELEKRAGESALYARAISEIGYIYARAGDSAITVQYLLEAASVAEQTGSTRDALRWRRQADMLRGAATPDEARDGLIPIVDQIEDGSEAYLQNTVAQKLTIDGRHTEAISVAGPVLEWAQREKDAHLEISVRNILAVAYWRTDQLELAIQEFHRTIQVADWSRDNIASIELRYNLAKAYIESGKYDDSLQVLLGGIAYSQVLLNTVETVSFRERVIAASLGLYELYALLASNTGNHMPLLHMTELVRARNLYGWLRADLGVERASLSTERAHQAQRALQDLRNLEVELQVRHVTRHISTATIASLQQQRREAQKRINSILEQSGLQPLSWKSEIDQVTSEDTESSLQDILEPGTALVSLFSVPEGICSVVAYRQGGSLATHGNFINWHLQERLALLAQLSGDAGMLTGRGELAVDNREAKSGGAQRGSQLEEALIIFRQRLLADLVNFLGQTEIHTLVVIPHRDLALFPYWELIEQCPSIQSLTLAPSLNALRLCLARKRSEGGLSLLIRDQTSSLPKAAWEIEMVKRARADTVTLEPGSIDQLLLSAPECALLHIAAHGLFDSVNPYYSGFLATTGEQAEGIFVRYAQMPSLEISERPNSHTIRLLTVAECMAALSLSDCRLAVLSTCKSGLSHQHGGGELTGLPNSLLVAGAKSVIASLWPVHDTAAALLMHYFYETWVGGSGDEHSPARALTVARRKLLEATPEDIRSILGETSALPPGDKPFGHPIYADAFHCFGSW